MMLPPPPVGSFPHAEPHPPPPQAESPSSISSGYSSIPPTSAQDFPFILPEPEANLEDLLDSEARPGVSELMRSHQVTTGEISDQSSTIEQHQYGFSDLPFNRLSKLRKSLLYPKRPK